jgi:predicted N-acyltransferase
LIYKSQSAKSGFSTISAGSAQSTASMPMRNASYLNYDFIPHDTQHFKNQGFCVFDVFLNFYAQLKNIKNKYKRIDFRTM